MSGMGANGSDRWLGIERPYTQADVERLRGTFRVEHTLARLGAERLWRLLHSEPYVPLSVRSRAPRPCRWSRPA